MAKPAAKPRAKPVVQTEAVVRPIGRPTLYDPKYCDEIVEFMSRKFSMTAFAGSIRVARSTLDVWAAAHPEFLEAIKVGRSARLHALEDGLFTSSEGPKVTAHIFALKNADPDEWREKQDIKLSGTVTLESWVLDSLGKPKDG